MLSGVYTLLAEDEWARLLQSASQFRNHQTMRPQDISDIQILCSRLGKTINGSILERLADEIEVSPLRTRLKRSVVDSASNLRDLLFQPSTSESQSKFTERKYTG